jgi:hypothetical protein
MTLLYILRTHSSSQGAYRREQILHQHEQMQRVIYEWGETGLRVERHCVSVDRVNDDNLNAHTPGSSCDLGESMKKQAGSEPARWRV